MALIPLFSFNDSIQAAFPLKGFTLEWYRGLSDNGGLPQAVLATLMVGTVAASLATAAGITIAYMEVVAGGRVSPAISARTRLPRLLPGGVGGIGLPLPR